MSKRIKPPSSSAIITLLFLLIFPASALEVKNPNELILEVSGAACSFCSSDLAKRLSKLRFVDRKKYKKGIFADFEKGLVTVALKPGKKIDLGKIKKRVRKQEYKLEAIHLQLNGAVKKEGANTVLVTENGQKFLLLDSTGRPWNPSIPGELVSIQANISGQDVNGELDAPLIRAYIKSEEEIIRSPSDEYDDPIKFKYDNQ